MSQCGWAVETRQSQLYSQLTDITRWINIKVFQWRLWVWPFHCAADPSSIPHLWHKGQLLRKENNSFGFFFLTCCTTGVVKVWLDENLQPNTTNAAVNVTNILHHHLTTAHLNGWDCVCTFCFSLFLLVFIQFFVLVSLLFNVSLKIVELL